MSASQTNFKETYFQYTVLTKISGDPTYQSLAKLEKECKANGKSVPSILGGGNQGHLGLVSSVLAYERSAPGTPFIRPELPVLPDLALATGAQIANAHHEFGAALKLFTNCNLIERSILQQINAALDDDCLADLLDDETGLLIGTIPELFETLFATYGAITAQSLATAKTATENIIYEKRAFGVIF
jgi:hypothetical protein